MTVHLDVRASVPSRDVDAHVTVHPGETVALLGPNGAGKSTVLGVISGLVRTDGSVLVDGIDLRNVPPNRRCVALLSQDPLLFPHLTALDNVAFAPRASGVGRSAARLTARQRLDEVAMGAYSSRRPRELSGGQAQRVAIARALASDPNLVLLDEPFAAIDAESRPQLRNDLRDVLAHRTAIVVTHDVLDALALASRVIVIDGGRVVEQGSAAEVLSRPRSAFAARLAGLNIITGTWRGTHAETDTGNLFGEPVDALHAGAAVVVLVRPSAVSVFRDPPAGSMRNRLTGPITLLEPLGDRIRVRIDSAGVPFAADITAASAAELDLRVGLVVTLSVKATETTVLTAAR